MAELRRAVPRQPVFWDGKYQMEGGREIWRRCSVTDVSVSGAALELADATPEEVDEHMIVVALRLRGVVINVLPRKEHGLRAGIQFVDLTDGATAYLESLERPGRW